MSTKRKRSPTPGHIRAHGNGWQIIVNAGSDPVTGRRRQVYATVVGTREDAENKRIEMVADVRRGKLGPDDHLTVAQVLDQWLEHATPDLAATTTYNYRQLIDQRITPAIGKIALQKLTAADLDRYYTKLRTELSPKTVRNIHAILRRALAQAQRWGWIQTNPATLASPPKTVRPDIRPPSREDVARFLAYTITKDAPFGTLCWLAAVTGARRGELAGLQWADLDTDTGTLLIERSIAQIGGETIVKDTKTHQARRIALDTTTLKLLEAQRDRLVDLLDADGTALTTDMPMFPRSSDFGHQHPDVVSKAYRTAVDAYRKARAKELKIKVDKVPTMGRLHDLRHFAATQALAAGIPVRTVAGRLGHANPATTHNVYAHFIEASDQAAAEVLGELVAGTE